MARNWDYLVNRSRFRRIVAVLWDLWTKGNELILNIETMPDKRTDALPTGGSFSLLGPASHESQHHDNVRYESIEYSNLRKIRRLLERTFAGGEVFYDLGCGKGRVLCVMAQRPFRKVVGVELFEQRCAVARRNGERLRWRRAPIEIICEDAAKSDLCDGTVYFMFNPFGVGTLSRVLENLKRTLATRPRGIVLIYYNAVHEDVLRSCDWLEMFHQFRTFTGRKVTFWRNLVGQGRRSLDDSMEGLHTFDCVDRDEPVTTRTASWY